jgi:PBSX family phage terminase large subunit
MWLAHVHNYENRGYKFIMTGATIASLKRNVLDELESMFGVSCLLNRSNEFELFGNTVACFGADHADSYKPMKGFTAYGHYGNEIIEHHRNSVDQAIKRCSGDGARLFWDTNPGGPIHYIKTDFIDRSGEVLDDGRVYIKAWHFVLDDNTFLNSTYIDAVKRSIPSGVWYDRDILGLWVSAEGMIYKDFNIDLHCIDEKPDYIAIKEYIAGVDWGFEAPGVIGVYGIDGDGRSYRLYEIVESGKSIQWWCEQATRIQGECRGIMFYCDPSSPANIHEFRRAGIATTEADNSVAEGIACVASRISNGMHSVVRGRNKDYLREIYNYRWRPGQKDEPIKDADHSMDSERYAYYTRFGKPKFSFTRYEKIGSVT